MARRILALSPHLDDAVFSCGMLLQRLAAGGAEVVVATVFTRSMPAPRGFALACQLDKGLSAGIDYMALRREEDREACRLLDLSVPRWLDFPEAPHRGYGSAAALFSDLRDDDKIVPSIAAVVASLVAEFAPDLILAPQAVGGHVDHRQLVLAMDEAELDPPVAWWCDFPYSVRTSNPVEPFADRFASLVKHEIAGPESEAKLRAITAYGSQVGFQFGSGAKREHLLAAAVCERIAAARNVFIA